MIKTLLSICIVGAFGLLGLSVVRPELATLITSRVLGTIVQIPQSEQEITTTKSSKHSVLNFFHLSNKESLTTESIIEATNKERVAQGLEPLIANEKLIASAKRKVDDMIARQYFEHISPTGENVSDLGKSVGYDYVVMGENLGLGNFTDTQDILTAWMNSPGHRANILNHGYKEMGAYAQKAMYNGKEVWFTVQHFGTTRTACPTIDTALKSSISMLNTELKKREALINGQRVVLESSITMSGEVYKEKVAEFNALVAQYNTLLGTSRQLITVYNKQVTVFNTCLKAFQKDDTN